MDGMPHTTMQLTIADPTRINTLLIWFK